MNGHHEEVDQVEWHPLRPGVFVTAGGSLNLYDAPRRAILATNNHPGFNARRASYRPDGKARA